MEMDCLSHGNGLSLIWKGTVSHMERDCLSHGNGLSLTLKWTVSAWKGAVSAWKWTGSQGNGLSLTWKGTVSYIERDCLCIERDYLTWKWILSVSHRNGLSLAEKGLSHMERDCLCMEMNCLCIERDFFSHRGLSLTWKYKLKTPRSAHEMLVVITLDYSYKVGLKDFFRSRYHLLPPYFRYANRQGSSKIQDLY